MMEPISVTVTGSRFGMTREAKRVLRRYFLETELASFHHGACVGVDEGAFREWTRYRSGYVHAWPATIDPLWDERWQSKYCLGPDTIARFDVQVHPAMYPTVRNRKMVECSDEVWAFPHFYSGSSGTWNTIQHGVRLGARVKIIYPNGSVEVR